MVTRKMDGEERITAPRDGYGQMLPGGNCLELYREGSSGLVAYVVLVFVTPLRITVAIDVKT